MDARYTAVLELDKVLNLLAKETAFPAGREKALQLSPATSPPLVQQLQEITEEARRLQGLRPGLGVSLSADVRPLAHRAALGGLLQPPELLEIDATLRVGRSLKASLEKLGPTFQHLAALGERFTDLDALEQLIRRSIGERGTVLDSASPALKTLRSQLLVAYERLAERLKATIESPLYRPMIQEPIITVRGGRHVIPLKAEFKGQLAGIVHDESASGATLFVEPLHAVELGNEWSRLQREEEREVQRILRNLSRDVGASAEDIQATVDALADLDLALAKGRLATNTNAVRPECVDLARAGPGRPALRLVNARHPLLRGDVVPITVELGGAFDTLVITGPNTGGKTVALKTVGLMAMMFQCGLQIPAEAGSLMAVFRGIYADIGDEQSIEQSLSTFSSHVTHIVDILEKTGPETLVLLDEIGAGTDPQDGSALARAILAYLRRRGAYTIATTHYPELKTYAYVTPGVENASVEFDSVTLSPTYRLVVGLPGPSNAFTIAERLGIPTDLLEDARSLLHPAEVEVEGLLVGLQAEREASRRAREEAMAALKTATELQRVLEERLSQLERSQEAVLENARGQSEEVLRQLRREVHRLLTEARAAARDRYRLEAVAREAFQLEVPRVPLESAALPHVSEDAWKDFSSLQPGAQVAIHGVSVPGTLLSFSAETGDALVDVRGVRFRVHVSDLRRLVPPAAVPLGREAPASGPSYFAPGPLSATRLEEVPLQIDLRGLRTEDARLELDKYLDRAYLAGLRRVWVIHGKGTGAVRQAVRHLLGEHSLVQDHGPAPAAEGGEGATVVHLVAMA